MIKEINRMTQVINLGDSVIERCKTEIKKNPDFFFF